ncbi:hypothetical protein VNO80_05904 [Phaseolus coccineus]|uniref:Uncharacterized protein n=1 Tax=Phaseolus coccineus TaxID=3886 RepID=A0AAN9NKW3_PHACN
MLTTNVANITRVSGVAVQRCLAHSWLLEWAPQCHGTLIFIPSSILHSPTTKPNPNPAERIELWYARFNSCLTPLPVDDLLLLLLIYLSRCDILYVVVEIDRILRPNGYLVVQDSLVCNIASKSVSCRVILHLDAALTDLHEAYLKYETRHNRVTLHLDTALEILGIGNGFHEAPIWMLLIEIMRKIADKPLQTSENSSVVGGDNLKGNLA